MCILHLVASCSLFGQPGLSCLGSKCATLMRVEIDECVATWLTRSSCRQRHLTDRVGTEAVAGAHTPRALRHSALAADYVTQSRRFPPWLLLPSFQCWGKVTPLLLYFGSYLAQVQYCLAVNMYVRDSVSNFPNTASLFPSLLPVDQILILLVPGQPRCI